VLVATVAAALAVLAVAFGTWAAIRPANDSGRDLPIYEEDASIMLDGNMPYRDFYIEYPPGALPMFVLPAVIFGDAQDAHWSPPNDAGRRYHRAFDSLVVLLTAAMVTLTVLSLAALRRPGRVQAVSLGVVASSPLLIGHVFVERYDVLPTALTAAALAAAVRGRYRLGGAALGLGAAAKIYPALLLPVLVIVAARHRGIRESIASAASAVGAAALVFLPFAIASWSATWGMLRNQLGGGLQVETLASSVLVMTRHVTEWLRLPPPAELTVRPEEHGLGRDVLHGAGIQATTTTLNVLLVIVLCLLWLALARSKNDPREDLVRYSAASMAAALVLGTVLSAQYITWLVPLVPLVAGRRGTAATLSFVAAAALTHAWFPSDNYGNYLRDFDPGATSLLLARNLALLATALTLVLPGRGVSGDRTSSERHTKPLPGHPPQPLGTTTALSDKDNDRS
jgi:glycosyl transferase family 87